MSIKSNYASGVVLGTHTAYGSRAPDLQTHQTCGPSALQTHIVLKRCAASDLWTHQTRSPSATKDALSVRASGIRPLDLPDLRDAKHTQCSNVAQRQTCGPVRPVESARQKTHTLIELQAPDL